MRGGLRAGLRAPQALINVLIGETGIQPDRMLRLTAMLL